MNKTETDPAVVNGKRYSLWPQFVEKKQEWIGGALGSHEDGSVYTTPITDITFEPCGDDSAKFDIDGKDFTCSANVTPLTHSIAEMGGLHSWVTVVTGGESISHNQVLSLALVLQKAIAIPIRICAHPECGEASAKRATASRLGGHLS